MKVPLSWLREFVDVPADPPEVARRFNACGFAVESIEGETLDIEVTANRPDCLAVYGLAREASAAWDLDLRTPGIPTPGIPTPGVGTPGVVVEAPDGCGRYCLAVADVTLGPSPEWLSARLLASGVRPINNIVDVTNYVMLETGQPMHAFDAARLAGPEIRVRRATPGERLTTLDGQARRLHQSMLVIADRDQAVAVAGVMGGASTEVSAGTTRVAFESAWFDPTTVRATSRALGLKTEASARFERGSDGEAPPVALLRALALIEAIGAGRSAGGITDVCLRAPAPPRLALRAARLARVLGAEVPPADVERILRRLAFTVTPDAEGWNVVVPSFRVDVTREADLVEEVGRHWGFDRIPTRFPALTEMPRLLSPAVARGRQVRRLLCGAGLQEAVTFTFIEAAAAAPYLPVDEQVVITNPLSEKFAVLRPSLVPGLLDSLEYNRNRQAAAVRLFEIGSVFSKAGGERSCVGWVLAGPRQLHWSDRAALTDFSDTKGIAELLAASAGASLEVTSADDLPWLTAGQRATVLANGEPAGWIGRLGGTDAAADPVFAGELDLNVLTRAGAARDTTIAPLPRFPSAVRDISILVDDRLPAERVRGTIRTSAPPTLVSIREFDRYQGKGVPDGQVSLSIRLTFRSTDRTLLDAEVQQAVDAIVAALAREHHATLRGQ